MKQISRLAMMSSRVQTKVSFFSAGNNGYGQLAINNSSIFPNVLTPPVIAGYTGVTQPDIWSMFSMRYNSVAAIKSDGTIWTAGENSYGQLAHNDQTHRNKFTQVLCETSVGSGITKSDWKVVGIGTEHIGALDAQGNIWCAGRNDIAGAIGNGASTGNVLQFYDTSLTGAPFREAPIVFKDLRVGHRFNMGLDTNNDIWTWGNNGSRQLGRASPAGVSNPTQDTYHRKVDVAGPWIKMFAGGYHAGGLHSNGELYTWGLYSSGQRGDGVVSQEPAIIPRIGGVPWVDAYMGENSTFLRDANGTLYGTGVNTDGQLGIGSNTNVTVPTALSGSWRTLAIDWFHVMGVKSDGTLWAWGSNAQGQLGRGNTTNSNVPVQIGTDTNWTGAQVGIYASLAYKNI
jgi:alpha-tubulin suppressor-like RCC1 family protein